MYVRGSERLTGRGALHTLITQTQPFLAHSSTLRLYSITLLHICNESSPLALCPIASRRVCHVKTQHSTTQRNSEANARGALQCSAEHEDSTPLVRLSARRRRRRRRRVDSTVQYISHSRDARALRLCLCCFLFSSSFRCTSQFESRRRANRL